MSKGWKQRPAIAAMILIGSCGAWANRYTITDLGAYEDPAGVNRVGVIGSNLISSPTRGEIYRDGRWHNLPAHSHVYAINRGGDSVGGDYKNFSAILWPHNAPPVTLPLPDASTFGVAMGVNNAGAVVGRYIGSNGDFDCFEWIEGQGAVDIDPGSNGCVAYGINNLGQITGSAEKTQQDPVHAFLYDQGKMTDLGVLEGTGGSVGYAINDLTEVIGISYANSGGPRGFLWNGSLVDLNPAHDFYAVSPLSINNKGEIVGWVQKNGENGDKIAARFARSEVVRLDYEVANGDGWKLETATSVNDRGRIVGLGKLNGVPHGFMLTPQ